MICADIDRLLDLLLDDALDDSARAELEAHAGVCPECAEKLRAAEQLKAILNDALPEADVPLAAQAKWRNAVRAEAAKQKKHSLTRTIGSVAAAAVVLVGVGIAINGGLTGLNPAQPSVSSDAQTALTETADTADQAPEALPEETEEELVLMDDAPVAAGDEALDEVLDDSEMPLEDSETALGDDAELLDGDSAMPMDIFGGADATMGGGMLLAEQSAPMISADEGVPMLSEDESALSEEEPYSVSSAAILETDGLEDFDADNGAPDLPMREWRMTVDDLDAACASVRDLLDEYEGEAEEQRSGDTANLFISLPAENLADFASAIAHLDQSGASEEWAQDADGDTASVLLILSAKE